MNHDDVAPLLDSPGKSFWLPLENSTIATPWKNPSDAHGWVMYLSKYFNVLFNAIAPMWS